jgi:hypothetical protein
MVAWLGRTLSGDQEVTWIGPGWKRVLIISDLHLVMMMTAGPHASPRQGNVSLDILYRFVPSVIDKNARTNCHRAIGARSKTSAMGHERCFRDVRGESAFPSTPEGLPLRSESTLRATSWTHATQQVARRV